MILVRPGLCRIEQEIAVEPVSLFDFHACPLRGHRRCGWNWKGNDYDVNRIDAVIVDDRVLACLPTRNDHRSARQQGVEDVFSGGKCPAHCTHLGKVGLLAVFEVPHRCDVGNGQRLAPRLHQPNKIDLFACGDNVEAAGAGGAGAFITLSPDNAP